MSTRSGPPPTPEKATARTTWRDDAGADSSVPAESPIPTQRNDDDESMCHLCGKRPRWDDTRFGHHDGWSICTRCLNAHRHWIARRAAAMGRTYLGGVA